jgi:hypothetical protein
MDDGFKVVIVGYCDESNHMYKLGRNPSLEHKGFTTMVAMLKIPTCYGMNVWVIPILYLCDM